MAKIFDRWHVPGGTIAIWSDYPGAYWAKRKRPYESWLLFGRDFEAAKAWLATPPDRDKGAHQDGARRVLTGDDATDV